MTTETYHVPVLFNESINALNLKAGSVAVDVTFGGGGHSKEILNRLGKKGTLVAFDQDDDAVVNANLIEDERLIFVNANFRFLVNFMKFYDLMDADAILADLGVSSHQFNTGDRGFSIREEGKLDMRMNQNADLSAHKVINQYHEKDLFRVFNSYADLTNTKKVVFTITHARKKKNIETTKELVDLLKGLVQGNKMNQFPNAVREQFPHENGRSDDGNKKPVESNRAERVNVILVRRGQRNGDVEKIKASLFVEQK